jgi:hypothetical protein
MVGDPLLLAIFCCRGSLFSTISTTLHPLSMQLDLATLRGFGMKTFRFCLLGVSSRSALVCRITTLLGSLLLLAVFTPGRRIVCPT